MRRVVKYNVIDELDKLRFIYDVDFFISRGWQPYGPPFVDDRNVLYQAVVKYEEDGCDATTTVDNAW